LTQIPFLSLGLAEARAAVNDLGFAPQFANRLRRTLLQGRLPEQAGGRGFVLPKALLPALQQSYCWSSLAQIRSTSAPDGAVKYLLRLADGQIIEAVRLPGIRAPSACISCQVGCAMACRFCASGLTGTKRNLRSHEFLEQIAWLRREGPVRRLVFMGSGEPTHNLREIVPALEVLRLEGGLGPRHILISTVGPPAAIYRLADIGLKFTLALSLHALEQDLRAELIPTQTHVNPLDLLAAADHYARVSGRPYQLEYVLLGGVNDSQSQARDLAQALKNRRVHVSLIGWNTVEEIEFQSPQVGQAELFLQELRSAGISSRLRSTVGSQADAACGQLRRRVIEL
jgi:23S rRNA (adenine2503-C2)-methyltransferase